MDISRRPKFTVSIEIGGIPNLRNRFLSHIERSILDNLTFLEDTDYKEATDFSNIS